MAKTMRNFAKWHIWLGWLVGVPVVMWTATGLYMVAKPIEEVRGNHLRIAVEEEAPLVLEDSTLATAEANLREMRVAMQDGRAVALLTDMDGVTTRVDVASGEPIPALTAEDARALTAERIVGGDKVRAVTFFEADEVPFDFRRPMPVWQVALEDGAHIYIGRDTGQIEAVRTSWWRGFDFMWGLHIMDLKTRSDTSHPILILFAALSLIGALMGCVLMFRRRRARVRVSKEQAAQ
ncbi:PepSY domain-containing protein [uncultured Erythrobacter sp.]|uniref:PepSY domain-containing protein n=1 Tax=uncultured Erythrobacter sp. TaxID=263913 RepID=UPI00260D167F|nr:PepSY domain-containing protein [uncultured Erythrobacter sp.]